MTEPVVADFERQVYIGGLMRCCIETIRTSIATHDVGERLTCRYCSGQMVVDPEGVWAWVPGT